MPKISHLFLPCIRRWDGEAYAWLSGERLGTRGFYFWHIALFLTTAIILYSIMPDFLLIDHDGQNLYFLIEKSLIWRSSWLETVTINPLWGMVGRFWPINFSFLPLAWPFLITQDPSLRIVMAMIFAALSIFSGCLIFFRGIGVARGSAVAASWLTTSAYMLQTLDFLCGTDVIVPIALAHVALGAFAVSGRYPGRLKRWIAPLGFMLATTLAVLGHPGWAVISLPVAGILGLAILASAEERRERIVMLSALIGGCAIQLAIGAPMAITLMLRDTARVMLADAFEPYKHIVYLAGVIFRGSSTEIAWGTLLIVGLAARPKARDAATFRLSKNIRLAALVIFGLNAIAALIFLYSSWPWTGPKPSYMMLYAYPLGILFAMRGGGNLIAIARGNRAYWSWQRVTATSLALSLYLGWHMSVSGWLPVAGMLSGLALLLFFYRWRLRVLGVVLVSALAFQVFRANAIELTGGRVLIPDATMRMANRVNPITNFLTEHVGLQPGETFRGFAEDDYKYLPTSDKLITDIVTHWAENWLSFGNGMKLFSWGLSDIPIISIYSPYIDPLYFCFFTKLLNRVQERQEVNYLSVTHPDPRILAMMGVRYLVSDFDIDILMKGVPIFQWEKFRIYQLNGVNLGGYTPTQTIIAATADETLTILADPAFNPHSQAVLDETEKLLPPLMPATSARLTFQRGGIDVLATSPGQSLLVLPVRFSHCWIPETSETVRLVRINLVQTGVLFDHALNMHLAYRQWPIVDTACSAQDLADDRRLLGR